MAIPLLFVIIVVHRLSIRISGQDTFDCTGYEDDSVHPKRNDCRYYWQCILVETTSMIAVKRLCPAGREFDRQTKQCLTASLVNCTALQKQSMSEELQILSNMFIEQLLESVPKRHIAHRRRRRRNFTLNILTSNEHRIRPFSINKTRGLLIQCNEIRRHQFRDFLFRTSTKSLVSSATISPSDLLGLIISFCMLFYFYKNK